MQYNCTLLAVKSFIVVAMSGRDQYEIIGLLKISRSIKQPCIGSSVCVKKALEMHQKF